LRLLGIVVLFLFGVSFSVRWTAGQSAGAETRLRAAVWVSPAGSDSSCVRGDPSRPCATLGRAYRIARSGDVVQVEEGTYSMSTSQTIPFDSSKGNSSLASPCKNADRVVFKKEGTIQPYGAPSDPVFTVPNGSGDGLTIKATCLTFNGLDFDSEISIPGNNGPSDNVSSITFENGRYWHNRGYPDGDVALNVNGNYIKLKNIEVGPICCNNDAMDLVGYPTGVTYGFTMDHVFMHDVVTACSQLSAMASWPTCSSDSSTYTGNHVDCVQTLGMGNWTIENSRILNCTGGGGAALQSGVYHPNNTYFDVVWENNVIDTTEAAFGCGGSCLTTYGNTYMFKATVPPGYPNSGTKSYFKVLYNTIQAGAGGQDIQPGGDYELVGNILGDADNGEGCRMPVAASGEPEGALWSNASYNLFGDSAVATACNRYGTNNTSGRPTYVDAAHGNWQLAAGSAGVARGGIALQTSRDLDGRLRPLRYPTDVGAYVSESAAISFSGRLGELRLGMSRAAVTARYGNPRTIAAAPRRPGFRAVATYIRHGGNVWVTYGPGQTVVGLATNSRYFTTAAGLGPGAPLSLLERVFPHFHAVCNGYSYRRTGGGVAVDLTVLRGRITRVAINGGRLAPSCK
jgi:hypothetical protein